MLNCKLLSFTSLLMLSLFPFAENQDDYAFDKKILYDNGREKDYLAIEKNGYPSNVHPNRKVK